MYRAMLAGVLVAVLAHTSPSSAQGLPTAKPEAVGMASEQLGQVRKSIQGFVDKGVLAGAVILVARDGKVVLHAAVGEQDREQHIPMSTNSLFRIASMTKPITSVAIMMLCEEGSLSLTAPVSKYLPEFKDVKVLVPGKDGKPPTLVSSERPITIRDLLTHRSGLTYGYEEAGAVGDAYRKAGVLDGGASDAIDKNLEDDRPSADTTTLAENVTRLATAPLVSQPGREWHYGPQDPTHLWTGIFRCDLRFL